MKESNNNKTRECECVEATQVEYDTEKEANHLLLANHIEGDERGRLTCNSTFIKTNQ